MLPQFNVALFETWGYYQMAIFIGFHGVLKKKLKCGNLMDIAQFQNDLLQRIELLPMFSRRRIRCFILLEAC